MELHWRLVSTLCLLYIGEFLHKGESDEMSEVSPRQGCDSCSAFHMSQCCWSRFCWTLTRAPSTYEAFRISRLYIYWCDVPIFTLAFAPTLVSFACPHPNPRSMCSPPLHSRLLKFNTPASELGPESFFLLQLRTRLLCCLCLCM